MKLDIGLSALLILAVGLNVYGFFELKDREQTITNLSKEKTDLTLAKNQTEQSLLEANNNLADLEEELDDLEDDYRKERNKNEDFEDQLKDLGALVGDLDKLSKTDEELLQKYSKVYFLNENYVPSDLDKINDKYILEGKDPGYFHGDALSFLEDMLDEADDDGIEIKVVSAYRSFDHQHALKGEFTTIYGEGANTFSADQGYSEHQLGTTVDLTDQTTNGTYASFAETEAYEWLLDNAHKYGFTLSYPEGNNFYIFEPWHWRFVGVDLAKDLHRDDAHFYDWDQREIDTYLLNIFD